MGRKRKSSATRGRKTSNRSNTRNSKSKKTISSDILGGILVVLGLILFVFIQFENIGVIAKFCKNLSMGLFGYMAYILPISLIIIGVRAIYSDEKTKISRDLLKGLYLTAIIAITVSAFANVSNSIFDNFVKNVIDSYNNAVIGKNVGGVIGFTCASVLSKFIGQVASCILLSFTSLISILCVFHISFKELFYGIYNIYAYVYNAIVTVINILFGASDEEDEDEFEEDEDLSKMSKRKRAKFQREQEELAMRMKEKGNPGSVDGNLTVDKTEQIEFDFNKLGGKPSEQEIQAKQQRDQFFRQQKEQKEDKSVKEVLTLDHTKHSQVDNYEFPPFSLLGKPKAGEAFDKKAIHATAVKLQKTLASFGVEAKVTNITKGPTVTRYELTPNTGVKVSKIVNLSDDIALNLAAKSIRIEAPIPGKAAVGIEVPNSVCESVFLREVIESDTFQDHKSKIAFALGKDAAGEIVVGDIAKMPHTLIAGATGSGKSVCINSLIVSILYKAKPSEVKMMLIDPKMVELSGYNGIPHLLIPVVTDPKKAAGALNWAVQEMVNRYKLFADKGVKDIKGYNKIIEKEEGVKLPQIVIIVDELADLMMVAPNDVEDAICRLAQMARAAGMHLVIATQRPSVDVITGIIKANIPSRIAFGVSSQVDSRTILDMVGAEKLLGKGYMLYFPVGETKPHRIQGAFISEKEIEKIVAHIKKNNESTYSEAIIESIENTNTGGKASESEKEDADPILNDAIDLVVDMGQASASMLQRRFKIGYSRAGRIVDQMEARGLISGYEGSKPRQVLISKAEWQELKLGKQGGTPSTSETDTNNDDSSEDAISKMQQDSTVKTESDVSSNEEKSKFSMYDIKL